MAGRARTGRSAVTVIGEHRFHVAMPKMAKSSSSEASLNLKKLTGTKITDLHRHYIDDLTFTNNGKILNVSLKCLTAGLSLVRCLMPKIIIRLKIRELFEQEFPG